MTFMLMQSDSLNINKPLNWLWICGDKETEHSIHNLLGHGMLIAKYMQNFSSYIPIKFKWLEDFPTTDRNTGALISLMFFICYVDKDRIIILEEFKASNTPMYTKP